MGHANHSRFIPASVAKIITCACAYETLGPNYTYKTRLISNGKFDQTSQTLKGDLILSASQDPTFSSEDLEQMLSSLVSSGIRHIEGKVLEINTEAGEQYFSPHWLAEDWGQDWMPVSSSFVVDRNVSSPALFSKTKIKAETSNDPTNAFFQTLLDSKSTNGWLAWHSNSQSIIVHQANNKEADLMAYKIVANPQAYNLALLQNMLIQKGITVEGESITSPSANAQIKETVLAEHVSKPLFAILKTTLRQSDNLYAQQILRTLGLQNNDHGSNNSNLQQLGLERINKWLSGIGVSNEEVILWDGCGLSRKNFITPHTFNMILHHMALQMNTRGYLSLLTPGVIKPKGNFQFKTGTMDSVRGVSGILTNYQDKQLALTILVNGHSPSVSDLRTSLSILVNQLGNSSSEHTEANKKVLKPNN